ncbi:unnamed protein product [Caenorhabditis auriculariae]|uniref:Uncharacterized protein n=1 Tax=Caenorhabditis auriculariae TaxID=2777116 RepID=A0A8S1HP73_9PELO|nr:unnamed protein product [Caenorhabditis auriculariae]
MLVPAYLCAHLKVVNPEAHCVFHEKTPQLHESALGDLSNRTSLLEHIQNIAEHEASICHRLPWSRFLNWRDSHLVVIPAFFALVLALGSLCELAELNMFRGAIRDRFNVFVGVALLILVAAVIHIDKTRLEQRWQLLEHAESFGGGEKGAEVETPDSWKWSIALCIVTALFKITRILIEHFFGEKKLGLERYHQLPENSNHLG